MKGTPASNRKKDATEKRFIEIASYCPDNQFGFVPARVTRGRPGSDFSAALEGKNYDQSQLFINLYRDTTASRAVEQLKKLPPPISLRYQRTERGVSNREGDTNISSSRLSARNRFLLHCHPVSGTPAGSNTETSDDCRRRQFSIGKLSVRKLPFQSNNSRRECRVQRLKRQKCEKGL